MDDQTLYTDEAHVREIRHHWKAFLKAVENAKTVGISTVIPPDLFLASSPEDAPHNRRLKITKVF